LYNYCQLSLSGGEYEEKDLELERCLSVWKYDVCYGNFVHWSVWSFTYFHITHTFTYCDAA